MHRRCQQAEPEGLLPRLDALLRRVGERLPAGYTVALVVVTFVEPTRGEPSPAPDVELTAGAVPG